MSNSVSRRTLARGSAWAVPAVAVAAAAPYAAASPQPGLNGWVTVERRTGRTSCTIEIDGRGSYPDRGLWVFNAEPTEIAQPSITFYLPESLGKLSWSTATGNSGWSAPTLDTSVPPKAGFYAYTSRYSGSYTYVPNGQPEPYTLLDGDPHFLATKTSSCSTSIKTYAYRRVVVKGEVLDFTRGPITL